jgi:hypothetical protein
MIIKLSGQATMLGAVHDMGCLNGMWTAGAASVASTASASCGGRWALARHRWHAGRVKQKAACWLECLLFLWLRFLFRV